MSEAESRRLPRGEDDLGKSASYSPNPGRRYPAPLPNLERMGGGASGGGDHGGGGGGGPRRKEWWTKPKMLMVGGALMVVLLLLIILPVALTVAHRASANATDSSVTGAAAAKDNSSSAALLQLQTSLSPASSSPTPPPQLLDDDADWLEGEFFGPTLSNASSFRLLPPPVAKCKAEDAFVCAEDGTGIGRQLVCDGVFHCPRGSDEDDCTVCKTSFSCDLGRSGNGTRLCLRGERLCDGVEDCEDKSDETKLCGMAACDEGQYRCEESAPVDNSGVSQLEALSVCVPVEWMCDGDAQCPLGDDELDCKAVCQEGAVWCAADKRCIPSFQLCDGLDHCPDGSDELNCNCSLCQGPEAVLCSPDQPGRCLARSRLCDSRNDCPNAEDEKNCPGWCPFDSTPATLNCSDGETYPLRYACSGLLLACDGDCESCDPEVAFTCPKPEAGPRQGPHCVPRRNICDGIQHCEGGEDEADELCSCEAPGNATETAKTPFRCPPIEDKQRLSSGVGHTKCVPAFYRCDGFMDCADGADERDCVDGCGNVAPGAASFYCAATQSCFPSTARCDGVPDCPDFSDEDDCDCTACKSQPYPTYMCATGRRCLKASFVCNPNAPAHCPRLQPLDSAVAIDQAHCSPLFDPLAPSLPTSPPPPSLP